MFPKKIITSAVLSACVLVSPHLMARPAVESSVETQDVSRSIPEERSVVAQVTVAASLVDVYRTWTTADGVKSFFAPNAIVEPVPGGLFEIQISPESPPGMRGADDMRFLALQPNRMVSFTWNAPPSLPQVRQQRTFVVIRFAELLPQDGKPQTLVRLIHAGWGDGGEWDQAHAYFVRAWPNVLTNLKRRFETGPIDWTAWLVQLRAAAQPRPGASSVSK